MTTRRIARCSIYDTRPEVCRVYPKLEHYRPEVCTYYFIDGVRLGSCTCDQGACCQIPRSEGAPGGAPMPEIAGGKPCRHLVWEEVAVKEASSPICSTERQRSVDISLGYDD
jgi:hypothetical protein